MEIKPTIKNLRIHCKKPTWRNSPFYSTYVLRHISVYLTWVLVRTPITANQITVLQCIFGIIGSVLFGYKKFLLGVLFLQLGYFLDLIDGEVARWKNQQSEGGKYLDLINHKIVIPAMFFGLGIGTGYVVVGMIAGLLSCKFGRS